MAFGSTCDGTQGNGNASPAQLTSDEHAKEKRRRPAKAQGKSAHQRKSHARCIKKGPACFEEILQTFEYYCEPLMESLCPLDMINFARVSVGTNKWVSLFATGPLQKRLSNLISTTSPAAGALVTSITSLRTYALLHGSLRCSTCRAPLSLRVDVAYRAFAKQLGQHVPLCDGCGASHGDGDFALDHFEKEIALSIKCNQGNPIRLANAKRAGLIRFNDTGEVAQGVQILARFCPGLSVTDFLNNVFVISIEGNRQLVGLRA